MCQSQISGLRSYLAGRAPLHYAAMHGRLDAIEALVEAGASVSRKDAQGGFTPLHLAADAGQCEAVETLLRLGAQLEPRSAQGWTPLGLATLKVILFTCTKKHDSRSCKGCFLLRVLSCCHVTPSLRLPGRLCHE